MITKDKMEDFELTLYDRLEVIRTTVEKYGEENFYLSFSGGKDSTIVSHLIDEALPNNRIPRVFINTGIEFNDIVKYVKELAKTDDRVIVYNSHVKVKSMLETWGYPFKSKEHAKKVSVYQHSGFNGTTAKAYVTGVRPDGTTSFKKCPQKLLYQFTSENDLKISDMCCEKLKKQVSLKYERESGKRIRILGTRMEESGTRRQHSGCVVMDKSGKIKKFKPINPITEEWCNWYVKKRNIKLCKLYYPPYNFIRTGCKGCPFALKLQEELELMENLMPNERKQCELLWGKVYDEYRRLNFRLKDEKK